MKNKPISLFLIVALAFIHEANAGKIVGTLESSNGPMESSNGPMDRELESEDGPMRIDPVIEPMDRQLDTEEPLPDIDDEEMEAVNGTMDRGDDYPFPANITMIQPGAVSRKKNKPSKTNGGNNDETSQGTDCKKALGIVKGGAATAAAIGGLAFGVTAATCLATFGIGCPAAVSVAAVAVGTGVGMIPDDVCGSADSAELTKIKETNQLIRQVDAKIDEMNTKLTTISEELKILEYDVKFIDYKNKIHNVATEYLELMNYELGTDQYNFHYKTFQDQALNDPTINLYTALKGLLRMITGERSPTESIYASKAKSYFCKPEIRQYYNLLFLEGYDFFFKAQAMNGLDANGWKHKLKESLKTNNELAWKLCTNSKCDFKTYLDYRNIISMEAENCCSTSKKCDYNEGNCKSDSDCNDGLACGNNNCVYTRNADWCFKKGIDYPGDDIEIVPNPIQSVATPEACQVLCQKNAKCKYWTYGQISKNSPYAGKCHLKNAKPDGVPNSKLTSGPRNCPNECFKEGYDYPGNDIDITYKTVTTPEACQVLCQKDARCKYWTYGHITEDFPYAGNCHLKNVKPNVVQKSGLTSGPRNCANECFDEEKDYYGNDIVSHLKVATPKDCQVLCQLYPTCKYWSYGHITENFWYSGTCFLKDDKVNVNPKAALTSGPRNCPAPGRDNCCYKKDVRLSGGKYPEAYLYGKWSPICGHWFWDTNYGATLFCQRLNPKFSFGTVIWDYTKKLKTDAIRVGKCQYNEQWLQCTGGCNDLLTGNGCTLSANHYNSKCGEGEKAVIEIKCHEPGMCYTWNGIKWRGTAPTNPTQTDCGLPTCEPCAFDGMRIDDMRIQTPY